MEEGEALWSLAEPFEFRDRAAEARRTALKIRH
jgi:hypothetical protein